MFRWALFFFIFALVAALFGFSGLSGPAEGIAQILFYVGLILFVIATIYAMLSGRDPWH